MGVALKELPVVSLTEAPTAGFLGVSVMSRQAPRISLEEGEKLECCLPSPPPFAFHFLGFFDALTPALQANGMLMGPDWAEGGGGGAAEICQVDCLSYLPGPTRWPSALGLLVFGTHPGQS